MNSPMVTVGLTCFNAELTIRRAVASALKQDWSNIEVIIVDDCSTDGSIAAVNKAIAGDSRARMVRHDHNRGPGASRNTIIREAQGEFIVFFDDDDESKKNRVSAQLWLLLDYEANSGSTLLACYASGVRRYTNGYVKQLPAIGSRGKEMPKGNGLADYLLLYRKRTEWFYGSGVPTCALMARASTFEAAGGFDSELRRVEDVDFAIRLALIGGHFIGTTERLFVQYATTAVDKSPEKNLEAEQRLAEKNKAYLVSIDRYYYALHWPKLRYWHFKRCYGQFVLELLRLIIRNPVEVSSHLLLVGPRRLMHERLMRRKVPT